MKNRLLIFILLATFFAHSCENVELDIQDNPNFPAADVGEIDAIFNSIQLDFEDAHFILEDQTGEVTRMYNATAQNYGAATLPVVFDDLWDEVYAGIMPDINLLRPIAELEKANIHLGAALILKAFILMEMVDVFGNIPYSQIGQGINNLAPTLDSGSVVYDSTNGLLDEALNLLSEKAGVTPTYDNFYGGDPKKWITLANTIKLRAAYLTGNTSKFDSIISAGDIIDTEDEDFQFNYGTNILNPDSRHPRYSNMYDASDGDYMSNYFMWLLRADKLESDGITEIIDPRIRYYFYRKVSNSDRQPTDSYGCLTTSLPDQNFRPEGWDNVDARLPYCYAAADGYTGRDHLNGSGIPADGEIRTAYGLYPSGGEFDANDFVSDIQNNGTNGAKGQGILPIILSSFVDFMQADVAQTTGNGDAKALLRKAVNKSLQKVRRFEARDADKFSQTVTNYGRVNTISDLFSMTNEDIEDYLDVVDSLFDNSAQPRDVIIKEYFIAAWGNGLEAFNMYRKTGLPANMEPPLQLKSAGNFPRSMRYANAFVDRNQNVQQKKESELVFWDLGTSNVY